MNEILSHVLNVYLYLMLMTVVVMFGNVLRILFRDYDGADIIVLICTCIGIFAVGCFGFKFYHDTFGVIMTALDKLHNLLVNG